MIDWSRIDELRDEVGEEDFAEIAALFLSEIVEAAGELPAILEPGARSDALHGMKGSAMNLGFVDLAAICAKGEAEPGALDMAVLSTTMERSLEAMRARFPELG